MILMLELTALEEEQRERKEHWPPTSFVGSWPWHMSFHSLRLLIHKPRDEIE